MMKILCDRCGNFVPDSELESQETFNYHKDLKKCHPKSEERLENEIKKLQSKLDVAMKALTWYAEKTEIHYEHGEQVNKEHIARKALADIEDIK